MTSNDEIHVNQMDVSNHIKANWSIRGDYSRTVTDAWYNGIRVRLPNYSYGEARHDPETETILISQGKSITTVIINFEHTEVIPVEKVECRNCGKTFQGREDCPICQGKKWDRS